MSFARTAYWRGNAHETRRLRHEFWRKLGAGLARIPFAEDLLAAYYCAFDRQTPLRVKAMLLGAIGYFVLPTDAVPDVMPVLGFTDDAAVLAATLKLMADHITPLHRDTAREALNGLSGKSGG